MRAPGVERVRWEVDGRVVAEPGPPFDASIPLEPGEHTVRVSARSVERELGDQISILVTEGASR